ncbi:MAG: tripartite tricarboxylate transporter substrate binding protein [Rhodoferax sp.]|nr:tripartite tricarboxylate transporter substrate binding protein [Rhodoferax sp.]
MKHNNRANAWHGEGRDTSRAMLRRRNLLVLFGLGLLPWLSPAAVAADGPIVLLVPFPAGGTTDLAARTIAAAMATELGSPVTVENLAGNDGLDAGARVANAPADGKTLFFATATALSYAPAARAQMPFDPVRSFTPIGQAIEFSFFLYVPADLPVKNLQEFMAYAKEQPNPLRHAYATGTARLAANALGQVIGTQWEQVAYRGDADVGPDLVSQKVQLAFASGSHVALVRQGKLRALVTLSKERSPLLPDVPTLTESGLQTMAARPWGGLFGPAGLPQPVTDRLSQALQRALGQAPVRQRLGDSAMMAQASSPADLQALVAEQLGLWAKAARDAGIVAK